MTLYIIEKIVTGSSVTVIKIRAFPSLKQQILA